MKDKKHLSSPGPRGPAAYGGEGWSARTASHRAEVGRIWRACGVSNEWAHLGCVLLHRPGEEIEGLNDPDAALMLGRLDAARARSQHDAVAHAYRDAGVEVHLVEPHEKPPPNTVFVADLVFMTPEGAILGRPASTVRAGEERFVARRLADLGIPMLRSIRGKGTFEGADAMWLDEKTVLVARGLRTNREGIRQVAAALGELGVKVLETELPPGTMHLMGQLRFVDRNLAVVWSRKITRRTRDLLSSRGIRLLVQPDQDEAAQKMAMNFVTLGPGRVLMPSGCPATQAFLESRGVECRCVAVDELARAAGGIACMTGVLSRAGGTGLRTGPGA
jgi:arginine deiminase